MLGNGIHDWPAFYARSYAFLKPGGWIEIPDVWPAGMDVRNRKDIDTSPVWQWFELFRAAVICKGIDLLANAKHTARLRDAGFINVKGKEVEWAVGGKSGGTEKERRIGEAHLGIMQTLIQGVTDSLLQHEVGMEKEKLEQLAKRAREELESDVGERGFFLHL